LRVCNGSYLAAGVQFLRKAGDAGIGIRGNARIVLVVILQRQGILRSRDKVKIGDRLIGTEIRGAQRIGVFRIIDRGRETISRRDQVLAVLQFVIQQGVGDGIDLTRAGTDRTRRV
jgi:hypothetical protein